jgi:hypothetical protein
MKTVMMSFLRHVRTVRCRSFLVTRWMVAAGVFFAAGSSALAQVVFDPAVRHTKIKVTDASGVQGSIDTRQTVFDLKLGYLLAPHGVLVGGMYKIENANFRGGDSRGYAIGPVVGWTDGRFLVAGTVFLTGERKLTTGGVETKYSSLAGYQLDLAYTCAITTSFGLGPQLTYRSVKFGKTAVGSAAESGQSLEETEMIPAIALHFAF